MEGWQKWQSCFPAWGGRLNRRDSDRQSRNEGTPAWIPAAPMGDPIRGMESPGCGCRHMGMWISAAQPGRCPGSLLENRARQRIRISQWLEERLRRGLESPAGGGPFSMRLSCAAVEGPGGRSDQALEKTMLASLRLPVMWSPSANEPLSISRLRGSRRCFWMARLSGRAP